ncbi:MAG: hypothetical protein H0V12_04915 [Chloroflexi bacterium]|nr:hypothetical protein [Chloroflexota bacterium]
MAHALPEYRTLGHVTVSPSHIELFNDIECSAVRGRYHWRLDGDILTFRVVDDPCAFGQRARDLTAVAWRLAGEPRASQLDECYPPNEEAGITGHWPIPSGC